MAGLAYILVVFTFKIFTITMKSIKNLLMTVCLIIGLVAFQACDEDTNDTVGTSRLQLKLVDEPGDYLEVNVEIIDIQYKSEEEGGWTSLTPENGYPINVDLTELVAGNDLLLVDEVIPSGILHQIRLVLSDNNTLVIEGENGDPLEPLELTTPSAQQSGLKLMLDEELEPGFSYTFILDWVVQESIVEAGNSGMYILKPVINVNTEVNSGTVSGTVIEVIDTIDTPLENVTVFVYTIDDTLVTDTLTDANGMFMVQGLGADNYKLRIDLEGYELYESEEMVIVAGEVLDVGTIELMLIE